MAAAAHLAGSDCTLNATANGATEPENLTDAEYHCPGRKSDNRQSLYAMGLDMFLTRLKRAEVALSIAIVLANTALARAAEQSITPMVGTECEAMARKISQAVGIKLGTKVEGPTCRGFFAGRPRQRLFDVRSRERPESKFCGGPR